MNVRQHTTVDFPVEELIDALNRCHAQWSEVSAKEHLEFLRRWTELYGELHQRRTQRRSGARALAEAQEACDGELLLVPCRDPARLAWKAVGAALRFSSATLPDLTDVSDYVDVFVSPPDFGWTLYFGHEVSVFGGPEFLRAEWMHPPPVERLAKRRYQR